MEPRNPGTTGSPNFLDLYVLTVIFTDWYRRINDVRHDHHILQKLSPQPLFSGKAPRSGFRMQQPVSLTSSASPLFPGPIRAPDLFRDLSFLARRALTSRLILCSSFIKFENPFSQPAPVYCPGTYCGCSVFTTSDSLHKT